jgi:hypothetical protein
MEQDSRLREIVNTHIQERKKNIGFLSTAKFIETITTEYK